jgi:glutathione S-transferase
MAAVRKALDESLPLLFDYLEGQVGTDGWIAGRGFSIGDVGVGSQFVNLRHAGFGVDATRWPKLARYIERVHARPSFKRLIDEEAAAFTQAA